jgi:hypothetical protein
MRKCWRALILGVAALGVLFSAMAVTGTAGAATTSHQSSGCHRSYGKGYWWRDHGVKSARRVAPAPPVTTQVPVLPPPPVTTQVPVLPHSGEPVGFDLTALVAV